MTAFTITTIDDTNLPAIEAAVAAAAEVAMDAGLAVIQPAVARETPVRTGFLRGSEDTFRRDPFTGMFRAEAFYASFVARRNPFIARGVDRSEAAAVAAFERVFEQEMNRHG